MLKMYPMSAITARSDNDLANEGVRYIRGLVLFLKHCCILFRCLSGEMSMTSCASGIAKKPITVETIFFGRLYKAWA